MVCFVLIKNPRKDRNVCGNIFMVIKRYKNANVGKRINMKMEKEVARK